MKNSQARHFRDDFRAARAAVLADAEAYARLYHALERFGRFLNPKATSLYKAAPHLTKLADESPLARLSEDCPEFHRPFESVLYTAREARNDVMHIGAKARNLTTHAVEACLVLEDALQIGLNTVKDFMVPNPVCVEMWHPLSIVRQRMLEHSFSALPVSSETSPKTWYLISDQALASFLGRSQVRSERLSMSIEEARNQGLSLVEAGILRAETSVSDALGKMGQLPLLVVARDEIVGIVTAFDLL